MASALRSLTRITRHIVAGQSRVPTLQCLYSTSGSTVGPEVPDPNADPTLYTADTEPPMPRYQERTGETTDLTRSRLLYQSRKRGMLENGLLLSTFAGLKLDDLNEAQLKMYDLLINKPTNDWEIYYWMTGNKETPEEYNNEVMDMLKEHAQNKNKESRIRQPDLSME